MQQSVALLASSDRFDPFNVSVRSASSMGLLDGSVRWLDEPIELSDRLESKLKT